MKVAICISGLVNSRNEHTSVEKNNRLAKKFFPDFDFYYATYHNQREIFEKAFPDTDCLYVDEPEPHYHPYKIERQYWESNRYERAQARILAKPDLVAWSFHHCKQHLIHAWLTKSIAPKKYDVIVRLRFDSWISRNADLMPFVVDAYENGIVTGMGATKKDKFDQMKHFDTSAFGQHHHWLTDQFIVHPNIPLAKRVEKLYNEKRLHPSEMGWWQILCQGRKHYCCDGWVNHDRNVLLEYFYEV